MAYCIHCCHRLGCEVPALEVLDVFVPVGVGAAGADGPCAGERPAAAGGAGTAAAGVGAGGGVWGMGGERTRRCTRAMVAKTALKVSTANTHIASSQSPRLWVAVARMAWTTQWALLRSRSWRSSGPSRDTHAPEKTSWATSV